jgi:hypothetical protein
VIAPVFVFDSREKWFPVGVEESLALHGFKWDYGWRRTGLVGVAQVVLDSPEPGRLDFPPDMRQPGLPPVGYHRTQRGGGLFWHQFWLWYLYNPWEVAGVGKHEGDWEFVQLGCADEAGVHPVLVTCSQHHSGGKREAWACTGWDGPRSRPTIYVALGSHANYFTAGTHGGIDQANGYGNALGTDENPIEWRPFGPWASWPGRWGNSENSPQSPARQVQRWRTPHLFHSSAAAQ